MYDELGALIRHRREALKLEQTELASLMSVRQQAVSGWERGRSRPRRPALGELAKVLEVTEGELVEAAGYARPKPGISPPVRSLTRTLPFDDLPEERFEDLTAEVMGHKFPAGHASRFGGRGHKQYGIDSLVTGSAGENLASAQCKRHLKFGPTAVAAAIADVTIVAKQHFLFLSRMTATPGARKEAAKHPKWELWDGEDISRFIRALPTDQAVRIVDTYFPSHREAFLGVASPGPWLLPKDYFGQSMNALYNHEWELVGRSDELDKLAGIAYKPTPSLSVLAGHGGLGKTRLLKALASRAPGPEFPVRILPGSAEVSPVDFELLPTEPNLVVIVDDAHETPDLSPVVAGIWHRNPHASIVAATRPYGRAWLTENLQRHGLLPDPGAHIDLGDLERHDAEALAREALGPDVPEAVVKRLASLTTDSPLTTVVGGALIRRGELDPAALEQDKHVREQIMRGFLDAHVRDPLVEDPPTRMAVLNAVAAMQPFRTHDTGARESLGAIVGQPYDVLTRHLRGLENAGILRRRGTSLRIVPDLLGDVILADAAYDEYDPLGTGYLSRIERLVSGASAENLFVNVSRVDWQVRQRLDGAESLVDSLWSIFGRRLELADIAERVNLAKLLARVAYFQPAKALRLCGWLIDNPTSELADEHQILSIFRPYTYEEVLHELPPVQARAALNFETLPEALSQLWELAQIDQRPTNQYPGHALRVLRDIAEFESGKPLEYNHAVIDTVQGWFRDGLRVSPFEVLEPMLATEGNDSSMRGHTITFRPFAFVAANVRPLRQRVIDLAFDEITSADLRRAACAVDALESALRPPTGTFGREVDSDERERWNPEFVATIDRLGVFAATGALDPTILVAIRKALHWHESYSTSATRPAAQAVLAALSSKVEALLALTVHDGWGHLIRDRDDTFGVMEAKRIQLFKHAIDQLSGTGDEAVVALVAERLIAEVAAFGPGAGHPGPLVGGLVEARPDLARSFLEVIRSGSVPALDSMLPVVLGAYAVADAPKALAVAREILAGGSPDLRRGVAQALSWNRGLRPLADGELALLLELAHDDDPVVRRGAVRAAQLLARHDKGVATRLLATVRFGDSPQIADDLFMCFHKELGITWDDFSASELAQIRGDLVAVDDIGEYSVSTALAVRSATDPEWVVTLLQERVMRAEQVTGSTDGYRALPFDWSEPLRVRKSPLFQDALRTLLGWIAGDLTSWARRKMGAEVFSAVAAGYDKDVVTVLTNALAADDADRVSAVAVVLNEAPRTFIWDGPDFVQGALHSAARFGDKAIREMEGALWGATISGVRSGTPGQPFAEDIEQRDRSRAFAAGLTPGSLEERFYLRMAASTEAHIARDAEDDLGDGRDW